MSTMSAMSAVSAMSAMSTVSASDAAPYMLCGTAPRARCSGGGASSAWCAVASSSTCFGLVERYSHELHLAEAMAAVMPSDAYREAVTVAALKLVVSLQHVARLAVGLDEASPAGGFGVSQADCASALFSLMATHMAKPAVARVLHDSAAVLVERVAKADEEWGCGDDDEAHERRARAALPTLLKVDDANTALRKALRVGDGATLAMIALERDAWLDFLAPRPLPSHMRGAIELAQEARSEWGAQAERDLRKALLKW